MPRAKHRAAGLASADVLATTLIQRFAAVPGPRRPILPFGAPPVPSPSGQNRPAARVRPQPVSASISMTVLGAAAAVTTAVTPPSATETTGPLTPMQNTAPAPAPEPLATPELTVPAPALAAERPTVQVANLLRGVTTDVQKVTPTVAARVQTVANTTALSSPAALRQAAVSNALSKLGKPYRWGAAGPNAFDCSGLAPRRVGTTHSTTVSSPSSARS